MPRRGPKTPADLMRWWAEEVPNIGVKSRRNTRYYTAQKKWHATNHFSWTKSITVTPQEYHRVSNQWQSECLFIISFRQTTKETLLTLLEEPRWLLDSTYKGPVMQRVCQHHDFIMPIIRYAGPRLNIKTVLSTYGDFHVKDKTAVRTSYL